MEIPGFGMSFEILTNVSEFVNLVSFLFLADFGPNRFFGRKAVTYVETSIAEEPSIGETRVRCI